MYFDDKHKAVSTIMSKRGSKGGEKTMGPMPIKPSHEMNEGGEVDGKHLAAQDILAAHHEGSASKLKEALINFMDLHNSPVAEDTTPVVTESKGS